MTLNLGAASGIGQGTAYMFAKSGARLVVTDRDEINLKETAKKCEELSKQKALAIVGDLTVQSDLENLMNTTMETFKQLDVLVNNAGDLIMGTLLQTSTEDFDKMMNINIRYVQPADPSHLKAHRNKFVLIGLTIQGFFNRHKLLQGFFQSHLKIV